MKHVGDMRATGNKFGEGEGRGIQISMATEAKVTGAMLVHKSLSLRSADCYGRKNGWEERQSWTTAERPPHSPK